MYSQSQIEALALLDKYFSETPESKISAEIQAVTDLSFVGSSAKDYFQFFHKYLNYEPFNSSLESSPAIIKAKSLIEYSTPKLNRRNDVAGVTSEFLYFEHIKSDIFVIVDYNHVKIIKTPLLYLKKNNSKFNLIHA